MNICREQLTYKNVRKVMFNKEENFIREVKVLWKKRGNFLIRKIIRFFVK
jgi:hypothetical protein